MSWFRRTLKVIDSSNQLEDLDRRITEIEKRSRDQEIIEEWSSLNMGTTLGRWVNGHFYIEEAGSPMGDKPIIFTLEGVRAIMDYTKWLRDSKDDS